MMKLPMTTFLVDLNPSVSFQVRQQFMDLDRHVPTKILPRTLVPATSNDARRLAQSPGT